MLQEEKTSPLATEILKSHGAVDFGQRVRICLARFPHSRRGPAWLWGRWGRSQLSRLPVHGCSYDTGLSPAVTSRATSRPCNDNSTACPKPDLPVPAGWSCVAAVNQVGEEPGEASQSARRQDATGRAAGTCQSATHRRGVVQAGGCPPSTLTPVMGRQTRLLPRKPLWKTGASDFLELSKSTRPFICQWHKTHTHRLYWYCLR